MSQKKNLEIKEYDWVDPYNIIISDNGNYICYVLNDVLTIQSTISKWELNVKGSKSAVISYDDRYIVFSTFPDSIGILNLKTKKISYLSNVASFQLSKSENSNWLACQLKTNNAFLFKRLNEYKSYTFNNVQDYLFSSDNNTLLIQGQVENNYYLLWINLRTQSIDTIWQGNSSPSNKTFDKSNKQLAFFVSGKEGYQNQIYYYHLGMDSAVLKIDTKKSNIDNDLIITNNALLFSGDGRRLFFSLKNSHKTQSKISEVNDADVNIWNYKDKYLQSQQIISSNSMLDKEVIGTINTYTDIDNILLLNNNINDCVTLAIDKMNNYVLINNLEIDPADIPYSATGMFEGDGKHTINLASTNSKWRKKIIDNKFIQECSISPKEKYVIYYDQIKKNYFTYNILKNETKNITSSIPVPLYNKEYDKPAPSTTYGLYGGLGVAGWTEDDEFVLIYDNYDIWQVDPNGVIPPINITSSWGEKNNTVLRIEKSQDERYSPVYKMGDILIIKGFNKLNKDEGYYKIKLGEASNHLKKLVAGPYKYEIICKSKKANRYVVKIRNATNAPNIYISSNLESYKILTDIKPQEHYNWLTTQLIRWETFSGEVGEGVLYKPENFDSTKKYPIIFHIYEKFSNQINEFKKPELSNGEMNVPYFVSNGYLVFEPDIHYNIGYPGESAYDYVISAAKQLSKLTYIDSMKMGLQGISFGGYEINFIIANTKIFAAASSSAGICNLVSGYGSLRGSGMSSQYIYETHQGRIGKTLWEKPDLYIKNSPIFNADRVSTPLLIMHNKGDQSVPWSQGIEWFTALRRLGKKVWMLEYDDEGHGIGGKNNMIDFSIRLKQFFDYYLECKSAPKWMTIGIPAILKKKETGLELDDSLRMP
ncbi:alpha/beta hydrolase family protein [Chitinophaga oryziterrae]|nr:prolyl oligopeptidase family serine peptidase [Chitinophaga oryziterrae]